MARVVACIFNTVRDAEHAVRDLMSAGFSDEAIGVVVHDREVGPGIADDLGREYRAGFNPPENEITSPSDVYQSIPGGFIKAMREERGTPEMTSEMGTTPGGDEMRSEELDWYTSQLDQKKVMLIVNAGDRGDEALRIMHGHGGVGRSTEPMMATPMTAPTPTTTTAREEMRMPVVDEEVVVEKTRHQVGEVEMTSETTSEMVEVPTSVTHEEIRVERRKLDHPMHPNDYKGMTTAEGVIRMPIVEEEIRVTKRPIIREEMVIRRVPVSEQQMIRETVTHTEPHVETTGDVEVGGLTEEMEKERKRRPAA